LSLLKFGLIALKWPKLVNFWYKFAQKGYTFKRFLQYLAWGRQSQVRALIPNVTCSGFINVGLQPQKSRKTAILGINLRLWKNFEGPQSQKKLNIDAQVQTILYAMTP